MLRRELILSIELQGIPVPRNAMADLGLTPFFCGHLKDW